MGHKKTSRHVRVMSVLSLKADIRQHVRHVPPTDIRTQKRLSPHKLKSSEKSRISSLRYLLSFSLDHLEMLGA